MSRGTRAEVGALDQQQDPEPSPAELEPESATEVGQSAAATYPEASHRADPVADKVTAAVESRYRWLGAVDRTDFARRYGVIVVWIGMITVFSILRPSTFPTFGNFTSIAGSQAVLVVVTLALTLALAAGEFDLSVAGIVGLSLVLVGTLNVNYGWPVGLAALIALAAGLVVGAINAYFTVALGIQSIVVTLGTGTVLVGVAHALSEDTIGGVSGTLVSIVEDTFLGIPLLFYYGLVLAILLWYIFSYTPFGRYLYFVGAGRDVARLAGVRVDAVRLTAFLGSGFLSALAGVILAGSLGAADPNAGSFYLLPVFAAAFLGSSIIVPGRFNPLGSLIAVYFLITGITGLELLGLSGWIEQVFYGGSLVLAVTFSHLAAGRRKTT